MVRSLLLLLLSISAGADERVLVEASLPFEMGADAVCFPNKDADLAKTGIPILGRLGVTKGVCQGIAGIAAAFRENVEFVPTAPAESTEKTTRQLTRAVRANRRGSGAKIRIRGYSSLMELCRASRMAFLKKAVWLNIGIALDDIFPLYGQFQELKREPIGSGADPEALRRQLAETLATALGQIREGRYPLLLYFSHVVLVRGYRDIQAADGSRRVELSVYDSNQPKALRTIPIPFAPDGIPAKENRMYWVLRAGGEGEI